MAMAALTLYWDMGGANMAPHAGLELIGAPHRLVQMDLARGDQHNPDYRKLNPNARVAGLVRWVNAEPAVQRMMQIEGLERMP